MWAFKVSNRLTLAAVLGLGLSACEPTPSLQLPQESVLQLAVEMEREMRQDIGKPLGEGLRVSAVERRGEKVSVGFTVTDQEFLELAQISDKRVLGQFMDSVLKSEFCKDPLLGTFVNAGLEVDFIFFDPRARELFRTNIDRC